MKILVNCGLPFALAHGGAQIQIERTMTALQAIGLQVEPVRWWDDRQTGDVIHYFGRMPTGHIQLARQKGIKVVMAELLTGPGSRSRGQLWAQKKLNHIIQRFVPRNLTTVFNWESYRLADAIMVNTSWEGWIATYLFNAAPDKIHIVPNGVEEVFLNSQPATRGPWLVCSATITERKRVLELARAAVRARTPLWVLGKPYAESDPYAQQFKQLAAAEPQWLRYEGAVNDRAALARIYRESRGFVLLSTMETRSLAAEEAAACECPLLLSDLPWAHATFDNAAIYCPITKSTEQTADALRSFYDAAPTLRIPPKPATWIDIAQQLKRIYGHVLNTSR